MKFNLIISILFLSIFLANFAAADVDVKYTANEGLIDLTGNLQKLTSGVNNYNVDIYTCLDNPCTAVGSFISTTHSNNKDLVITFPSTMPTPGGYLLYFYKDGYIGWEQRNVIAFGSLPGTQNGGKIYLAKKELAYAPITNLSVLNEVSPNTPIEIGVRTLIDADTHSAITDSRISDVPLKEDVETKITLEIFDSDNNLFYTDEKIVFVPYSNSVETMFIFDGFQADEEGDYKVQVSAEVTDIVAINQVTQKTSSNIKVLQENETNYAFTLINNLDLTPVLPVTGEEITFSFKYNSGYVDSNGDLTNIDTKSIIEIIRNGISLEESGHGLSKDESSFSFKRTFNTEGSYKIIITGTPEESSIPSGILNTYGSDQELTFIVGIGSNETDGNETTNHAPILSLIGNKQVTEGDLLEFQLTATDPDNDSLTYSLVGDFPEGASFNDDSFSWTPTLDQSGEYVLGFLVSDGNLSSSEVITITVINFVEDDDNDNGNDTRSSSRGTRDSVRQSISLLPLEEDKSRITAKGVVIYPENSIVEEISSEMIKIKVLIFLIIILILAISVTYLLI